jgi:hypothetical protein
MFVKKGEDDMNATPPPGSTCYRVASGHVDENGVYIYVLESVKRHANGYTENVKIRMLDKRSVSRAC